MLVYFFLFLVLMNKLAQCVHWHAINIRWFFFFCHNLFCCSCVCLDLFFNSIFVFNLFFIILWCVASIFHVLFLDVVICCMFWHSFSLSSCSFISVYFCFLLWIFGCVIFWSDFIFFFCIPMHCRNFWYLPGRNTLILNHNESLVNILFPL